MKNGLPNSYSTTIQVGANTLNVTFFFTKYTNETPPFHVFFLPEGCSQSCGYCYNSASGVAGILFLLIYNILFLLSSVILL